MKCILALIDFSPVTAAVVKVARDMARVILLHVLVPLSELAQDEAPHDLDSHERRV